MATTSILPTNSLEEFRIQFNNLVSDVSGISVADTVSGDFNVGDDLNLTSDGAVLSFGTDSEITLTHVHNTGLKLVDSGGSPTLQLHDSGESVSSDGSKLILTSNSVAFSLPTADGTSGQIIQTDGSGTLSFATASANTPTSADGQALGSAALEWSDLYLADGGIIYLGNDQDINITHVADTGITTNGTFQATTITATTAVVPDASDGAALGTTSLEWSDLFLADGGIVYFGDDQEITLTHVADTGLNLKHAATADDKYPTLTLQTGDTDIAVSDKLGVINFQAPDETTGTDAILVAAGIEAVSEGDFSSSNNATKLSFKTAASAEAAETASLSSTGVFTATSFSGSGAGLTTGTTPIATLDIDGGTDIGADIVDGDLFVIDDGAGGANRKTAASRIKTYVGGGGAYFLGGASGATGDTTNGLEDIFRVNSATADTSCTIASSTNASATGPLTVSSGVTITIDGVLAII